MGSEGSVDPAGQWLNEESRGAFVAERRVDI